MKLSEIIDKAAKLLASEDNWNKGMLISTNRFGDTTQCVMGAIQQVVPRSGVMMSAAREITTVLKEQYPDMVFSDDSRYFYSNVTSVTSWNDTLTTKHAEVVAVLEKTRNKLQERGE